MKKKIHTIILKRIFVFSLPFLVITLANAAVSANLKNFCLFKLLFHKECFGCGLTRAFAALSRFEFSKAYDYNHLIVIIVPILLIIWFFLIKESFKKDSYNE